MSDKYQWDLKCYFMFETETNFKFCQKCIKKMCEHDLPYHHCEFAKTNIKSNIVYLRMEKVVKNCKRTFWNTVLLSMLYLKKELGKDLMVKIMKQVVETRKDLCLWYREPIEKVRKSKGRKNEKLKF